jgi:hypothetical protein
VSESEGEKKEVDTGRTLVRKGKILLP